jgi:trimethylamine--corrinoid protein Co-methyltransferase
LAGANLIYGLGMLESGVTFDYGQLVMDNEFAAMIKHVVNGIPVDDESLAVEVIDKVGPFGQFLSEKHTFAHMRRMSQPKLIDRRVRDKWVKAGSRSMHQLALDKAREIYANHKPDPLPEEVLARMRAIVERTEEDILEEQRRKG